MLTSYAYAIPGTVGNGISVEQVINAVCKVYELTEKEIKQKKKAPHISAPRMVAMHIIRFACEKTQFQTAAIFGLDHASSAYATKTFRKKLAKSDSYRKKYAEVCKILNY